jgi:hypothetical protein
MILACSRQANNVLETQNLPVRVAPTRPTLLFIAACAVATPFLLEKLGTSHRSRAFRVCALHLRTAAGVNTATAWLTGRRGLDLQAVAITTRRQCSCKHKATIGNQKGMKVKGSRKGLHFSNLR